MKNILSVLFVVLMLMQSIAVVGFAENLNVNVECDSMTKTVIIESK